MGLEANLYKLNHEERKVVTLSALGGMLEFYDFVIYGIFSVYFAQQFFPGDNPLLTIIKSYLVFILGYVARPIGGIIFSHIGDNQGRKKVLIMTIVLMGLSSLAIGLLPTYEQLGVAAPLLLLLFRLVQGLAIGGELPSTYVYICESLPQKMGTGFGLTMFGVNCGLLLGMAVNVLLTKIFTAEELIRYGWRLPFIFGGLLCIISYQIRRSLSETAAFVKIHDKPTLPLATLMTDYLPQMLIGIAITSIMSSLVVLTIVFMPTYLKEMVGFDTGYIGFVMPIIMLFNVITIFLTGKMANSRSPLSLLATLLRVSFVLVPISYWLISTHSHYSLIGLIVLAILEGMAAMLIPMIICSLFSTSIRLTGVAFCYNMGFTVFGGLAPVLVSTFINLGYNIYLTPVVYLSMVILICGLGLKALTSKAK